MDFGDFGGPAFPFIEPPISNNDVAAIHGGMTLRDYFAAAALQGRLAGMTRDEWADVPHDAMAIDAYDQADAMLKARKL